MLGRDFYICTDTVSVARKLIGKKLVTFIGGRISSGIISETEAYTGVTDRASHAWGGRKTRRTEVMYRVGGTAYVYLCYGMHAMFNVVTGPEEDPQAILIRGIQPIDGLELMQKRRGRINGKGFTDGPGKVALALGILPQHSGLDLVAGSVASDVPAIWIEDTEVPVPVNRIFTTTRIGVDYAGPDALLPYRFVMK